MVSYQRIIIRSGAEGTRTPIYPYILYFKRMLSLLSYGPASYYNMKGKRDKMNVWNVGFSNIIYLVCWEWIKDWILSVIMIGVVGAGIWRIVEDKCKTFLIFSEYEKEVLNDLKELRNLLEWQIIEKPWLGEKSKDQRTVNSYKARDQAFLWEKLCRDWIQNLKSHDTEEALEAVDESIRLIQESGIRKAKKIRKEELQNSSQREETKWDVQKLYPKKEH